MAAAGRIGVALRNLRRALRLRQEDFAARLFVARETISDWEQGYTRPPHETRVAIVAHLADAPAELLLPLVEAFGIAPPPGLRRRKATAASNAVVLAALRAAADELDVSASALRQTMRVVVAHLGAAGASLDDAAALLETRGRREPGG